MAILPSNGVTPTIVRAIPTSLQQFRKALGDVASRLLLVARDRANVLSLPEAAGTSQGSPPLSRHNEPPSGPPQA
jgi:hypothetical protein